jgi:diguanylate cyclase (GGDEF)-like protein
MGTERLYSILRNLLAKTAGLTGEAFLRAAVQAFAREFDARFVFIAQAVDVPATRVRMLAAFKDGGPADGWDFDLQGTPCEAIYQSSGRAEWAPGTHMGTTVIARDVCHLFEPARGTGYESFIGVPLHDGNGLMIGHVALFSDRCLTHLAQQAQMVELVSLYALKVEAELNRLIVEAEREQAIRQLAEANARLARDSITDALTRLHNRRHFTDRIQRAFLRYQRERRDFALMILDLDHFKAINDAHGHVAGDRVLKATADCLLRSTRRGTEEVFRVGGEEFVILFHEAASKEDLTSAARRLNGNLRDEPIAVNGQRIPVSASIGGAFPSLSDEHWEQAYRRADAKLYQAKQLGRDRAVI